MKNRITIRCSISTPGYISKENENNHSKQHMHPYVHRSIIYKSQYMEATYVSINR